MRRFNAMLKLYDMYDYQTYGVELGEKRERLFFIL